MFEIQVTIECVGKYARVHGSMRRGDSDKICVGIVDLRRCRRSASAPRRGWFIV